MPEPETGAGGGVKTGTITPDTPARPGFVGRHRAYPDLTGKRVAEGGRRLGGGPRSGTADEPLVTILTVCWNSAATIEQTIRSVREQTYGAIEHVVVDGASTDGTLDILRRHEEAIDYFVSEPDKGLYQAMNKGLELAQGELILILNSDDWYTPDCVETLVAARREAGVDFVSALANYVDGEGRHLRVQPSFSFDGNMLFMMPLRHETMLVPAAVYDAVGPFDTSYRIIADRELTTRIYEAGFTHLEVKRPLMHFRDTGVSTVNLDALREERKRLALRNFPVLSEADATRIAWLEQLEPAALAGMVARYGDPRLARAAADLVADRQGLGVRKWMELDPDTLRAAAPAPTPAPKPAPKPAPRPRRTPAADRPLTIATFITSDSGGAGMGSQRRVEALRKAGMDARIYCLFRNTDRPWVSALTPSLPGADTLPRPEIHKEWRRRSVIAETDPELKARELFSSDGSIIDFREHRDIFETADIVHLHWTVGMLDYPHLAEAVGQTPVVWTPADMNPFTGGCHYSEGCTGYTAECRACPLLSGGDRAHGFWRTKRDAYAQIPTLHVVSPSVWLANRARQSTLFAGRQVHVIPNALPIDRFSPTNKMVARRKLGLPLDKKLILFGADNVTNLRKGGDLMIAAIRRLKETGQAKDVHGVYFGSNALSFPIPTHGMGKIDDEERLSLVYAATDVFASPTREDSGPMTVAEAMLSGTPVVTFDVGNGPEILVDRDTGYIAAYEDADDFARGLAWLLAEPRSSEALLRGIRCHLAARAHNDPATAAERHIRLYREILAEAAARA